MSCCVRDMLLGVQLARCVSMLLDDDLKKRSKHVGVILNVFKCLCGMYVSAVVG